MIARSRDEKERAANPRDEKRRGLSLRALAQIAIGVGALALVVVKAEPAGLAEAIKATRISYLPLAVLASLVVTWLMAYRWGVILNVRCHHIKTHRLFTYYLIGIFFMNFVPGGGVTSDVARLIYVDREVRDKPFVLSTLVYERMVGLFTLLLIGLGATLASRIYRPTDKIFYLSEIVLAVAFFVSAMLMSDYVSSRLARLSKWVGTRFGIPRVGEAASRTLETIAEMRRYKGMLLRILLLSVAIRVIWSLGCFVVAQAMGLPLGLPVVFAFISLVRSDKNVADLGRRAGGSRVGHRVVVCQRRHSTRAGIDVLFSRLRADNVERRRGRHNLRFASRAFESRA